MKLLRLTGPATYASPATYGIALRKGDVIRVSDTVADSLQSLSLPDISGALVPAFALHTADPLFTHDFVDDEDRAAVPAGPGAPASFSTLTDRATADLLALNPLLAAAFRNKADLVTGKVPVGQLPSAALAGSSAPVSDGLVTTPWRLSGTYTKGSYTLSGPLAIDVDQANSIDGGSTTAIIVSDGVNVPTVGGIALTPWTNVAATAHQVIVKREGSVITVHVGPAALSIPLIVPAAPTAGKPVIAGSPSTSAPLAWTAGAINGVPSPTVIYALVDSSNTVLQDNIVSGAYTRSTAVTGAKIRVTLANSQGTAIAYSDPFDIAAITVPGAPSWAGTPFTAISSSGWTANLVAPANNGGSAVTDYDIQYRLTGSAGSWTAYSDGVNAAPVIAVAGVASSTQFDVQVRARNAIGPGAWSATAVVTTLAGLAALSNIFTLDAGSQSAGGVYTATEGNGMLRSTACSVTAAGDFDVVVATPATRSTATGLSLRNPSGYASLFQLRAGPSGSIDLRDSGLLGSGVPADVDLELRFTRASGVTIARWRESGGSWTQIGGNLTVTGSVTLGIDCPFTGGAAAYSVTLTGVGFA